MDVNDQVSEPQPPQLAQIDSFEVHSYPTGAVARRMQEHSPLAPDEHVQLYVSAQCTVAFVGRIDNSDVLRKYTLGGKEACSDPELIAHLYRQRKTFFIATLRGQYAFAVYDPVQRTCTAGRDQSGSYTLLQGTHAKTAGLIITNDPDFPQATNLRPVPAGNFVFGRLPSRHPHVIGQSDVGPVQTTAVVKARDAVANALMGITAPPSKPLNQTIPASQTTFMRSSHPLCELTQSTPPSTDSNSGCSGTPPTPITFTVPSRLTTTPSARGTADKAVSWRKGSVVHRVTSSSSLISVACTDASTQSEADGSCTSSVSSTPPTAGLSRRVSRQDAQDAYHRKLASAVHEAFSSQEVCHQASSLEGVHNIPLF